MMDHLTEFQSLLQKLLSPDNDSRKAGEDAYEEISKEQKAQLLFLTANRAEFGFENRQLALVLLRRLLGVDWQELWGSWPAETQATFCNEILMSTQIEQNESLRKRFCDLIAEIARNRIDEECYQSWQDVLKFLFGCATNENPRLKETALLIIANIPGIFGRQLLDYMEVIKEMLASCLQYTSPAGDEAVTSNIRMQAVKAATAFIIDNEDDQATMKQLQPLVIHILHACVRSIEQGDDDGGLQCLVQIATDTPKLLRPHLTELYTLCIKTISDTEMDDNFRHSALEVLVSLAESNPSMVRKRCAQFIPEILHQCLGLMVDLDEDPDWWTSDDQDDDDEDNNASVGETSLDRLACALGGKVVLQPCLSYITPMMQNPDWKYRHAGLMAISTIGEGCHQQMDAILEQIVDSIIPFLNDPNPRVRYAACNAIGQLSSDFAPKLQKQMNQKIIPALLGVLEDLGNPRVAAHAGAAFVNFSEDAPKSIMVTYLDPVMTKLLWVLEQTFSQLVEKGKKLVLEQIVTTIAAVADSAEDKFAAYYQRVMPCLKYILLHAVQPELRLLRGKTIECVSLIGLAVGKITFMPDASEIMDLLLKTQTEFGEQEGDDPQVSYMMSAWARMCTILGPDFVQYLPMVMPAVMKVAAFKPEVAIVECESADHLEEEDWQFVNLGDQQSFGIKTAGLEDKAAACQMLVCYARELKAGFADYVESTTQTMVPLLKFYFHDGVRTAAAESLPELLEAAKVKGAEFVTTMWQYIFKELLKASEEDPEQDVLSEMLWSLAKCIECLGTGCLSGKDMEEIARVLENHMSKHFEKANERDEVRKDEDYDEEVENDLVNEHDEDTFILSKVSDVLHAMFGTHREAVLPHFEKLLPHLLKLLEPNRPYPDYQWALCMFDDVIEFGGLGSMIYREYFLAPMVRALEHHAPEVRQAAAYGFGIMGMHGGNGYAQACAEAIPFLAKMVGASDARENDANTAATENAIAAVGKILKYNNSSIDMAQVLPAWLGWLPVWEDKDECPHIYGYLCDLIESNNPLVMGENGANFPHLVAILVEALRRDALTEETEKNAVSNRITVILRHVQASNELLQACLAILNDEQKMVLQKQLTATV